MDILDYANARFAELKFPEKLAAYERLAEGETEESEYRR